MHGIIPPVQAARGGTRVANVAHTSREARGLQCPNSPSRESTGAPRKAPFGFVSLRPATPVSWEAENASPESNRALPHTFSTIVGYAHVSGPLEPNKHEHGG